MNMILTLNVSSELTRVCVKVESSGTIINWEHLLGSRFINSHLFKGLLRPLLLLFRRAVIGVIAGVCRSLIIHQPCDALYAFPKTVSLFN